MKMTKEQIEETEEQIHNLVMDISSQWHWYDDLQRGCKVIEYWPTNALPSKRACIKPDEFTVE